MKKKTTTIKEDLKQNTQIFAAQFKYGYKYT